MGLFDNVRGFFQRLIYGKSTLDIKQELSIEKDKNKRLQKKILQLKDDLFNSNMREKELIARLELCEKEMEKMSSMNNQKVSFKTYYSILGVEGSIAKFEFDIEGILPIYITETQIMNEFSSESFFDSLMSLYDMLGSVDSSMISGVRTSGITKVITSDDVSTMMKVDFSIKDTKKPNDLGGRSILNPFKQV